MNKWIAHLNQLETVNAVYKAKADIPEIGESMGYVPFHVLVHDFANVPDVEQFRRIDGITAKISRGDLVVYQYPSHCSPWFDLCFIRVMKWRGAHPVILLHDVDSMRLDDFDFDELSIFNEAEALITLSEPMNEKLREMGFTGKLIAKGLWDYLIDEDDVKLSKKLERKLVLAGQLSNSPFLSTWDKKTELSVFGGGRVNLVLSEKVKSCGAFHQAELIRSFPRDSFGIAWYNNTAEKSSNFQEYSKYITPHKLSLYLALGLPVIVWEGAAVAPLVKKYQIGYTLKSLDDIDDLMTSLSEEELLTLKERVNRFSRSLREGYFTRRALIEAEKAVLFDK